jgi:hypothetical protein
VSANKFTLFYQRISACLTWLRQRFPKLEGFLKRIFKKARKLAWQEAWFVTQ